MLIFKVHEQWLIDFYRLQNIVTYISRNHNDKISLDLIFSNHISNIVQFLTELVPTQLTQIRIGNIISLLEFCIHISCIVSNMEMVMASQKHYA